MLLKLQGSDCVRHKATSNTAASDVIPTLNLNSFVPVKFIHRFIWTVCLVHSLQIIFYASGCRNDGIESKQYF